MIRLPFVRANLRWVPAAALLSLVSAVEAQTPEIVAADQAFAADHSGARLVLTDLVHAGGGEEWWGVMS